MEILPVQRSILGEPVLLSRAGFRLVQDDSLLKVDGLVELC